MNDEEKKKLMRKATDIRKLLVTELASIGVGHVGGCLSVVDALVVLYYRQMKNLDPKNPHKEGRDRFVMSKGHAGPAVYAVLADKGYFPLSQLETLNQPNTSLPSHCDMLRTPGIDMTAGSLGQGLSCAVGMAKASKIKGDGAADLRDGGRRRERGGPDMGGVDAGVAARSSTTSQRSSTITSSR
jgi:transketolase